MMRRNLRFRGLPNHPQPAPSLLDSELSSFRTHSKQESEWIARCLSSVVLRLSP